jgi:cell division protein FtsI (penicillin-binding protein 3)
MDREIENDAILNRKNKLSFLFIIILLMSAIFLYAVLKTITSDRRIPSNHSTLHDRSFRGSIISADGYTLSRSQKSYQAIIRGASISPDKKELFIRLFSIYSGLPIETIRAKFTNKTGQEIKGNIILSDRINSHTAMRLKSLAYKLRAFKVFQSIKNHNGVEVVYGLDIIENGESRLFPLQDILSPTLGYVGKEMEDGYTRPSGKKGLERAYEKHITSKKNGYFRGKRDVVGSVIHDKNVEDNIRVDGLDLHLNIPIALQRRVELMSDQMRLSIDADEILVAIMESTTGKILTFSTTKRYNPAKIRQADIPALVPKFTEYPYEAGSVLKPLTIAIALDHGKIQPNQWFNTGYRRFPITARQYISDDEYFKSMSVIDIIVHSSNIGTSKISWLLTGKEYREGLLKFGLAQRTGIDLSRDLPGMLKPIKLLNHKMHRANSAFGYGMMVTPTQMLKAYSAFNNEGIAVTPRLVDYLQDDYGNHYKLPPTVGNQQAISPQSANAIKSMLMEVVKRGTGIKAQYKGLEVGGKTGTAHIAKNGRYSNEYHSSFYGFANDSQGRKYTIGVLVIRAKGKYKYFAAKSAVPTFRHTLDILVELNYLKPDGNITLSPKIYIAPPETNSTESNITESNSTLEENQTSTQQQQEKKIDWIEEKVTLPKPSPTPKPQPRPQPKPTPKPILKEPDYRSFEDMF